MSCRCPPSCANPSCPQPCCPKPSCAKPCCPPCSSYPTGSLGSLGCGCSSCYPTGGLGSLSCCPGSCCSSSCCGNATLASCLGIAPGASVACINQIPPSEIVIQPPPAVVTVPGSILAASCEPVRVGGYTACGGCPPCGCVCGSPC